jgi:hypothetical protein
MPERVRDLPPRPSQRSPRLLPLLLIVAGGVLLLANLGLISPLPILSLLNLWPLVLIAVGVNLITTGRYRTAITAITVLLALAWVIGGFGVGVGERTPLSIARGEASSAHIDLRMGVGELLLRAHPNALAPLISGDVFLAAGEELIERVSDEDGVRRVRIDVTAVPGPVQLARPSEATWSLALSRDLPLSLRVQQGLGRLELDLSDVQLSGLNLEGGLGEMMLTLPSSGGYRGDVSVGAGSVSVLIPSSVAVRVVARRGLGAIRVEGDFVQSDERYTTPGFDEVADDARIELTIQGGLGSISVRQLR